MGKEKGVKGKDIGVRKEKEQEKERRFGSGRRLGKRSGKGSRLEGWRGSGWEGEG